MRVLAAQLFVVAVVGAITRLSEPVGEADALAVDTSLVTFANRVFDPSLRLGLIGFDYSGRASVGGIPVCFFPRVKLTRASVGSLRSPTDRGQVPSCYILFRNSLPGSDLQH